MRPTIALDAMGGDHGPAVVIPAAHYALSRRDDLALILVGRRDQLLQLTSRTAEAWSAVRRSLNQRGRPPEAADYLLTNAHRRRVSLTMNLRELYHFSRLREDLHAQWAIRDLASRMSALARRTAPVTAGLLGGKHAYAALFSELMENRGSSDPGFAT